MSSLPIVSTPRETDPVAPPTFEQASNRRQQARAAGLSPDYWYPVAWEHEVARGKVLGIRFWKRSIAIFRGSDDGLRAVEDRCAHRQLKLSLGQVDGCHLTCAYHGWKYSGDGRCVEIPHDLFGHAMPKVRIASYPVQVRYGLIWVFPGKPELASKHRVPDIPEIEGRRPWARIPLDFVWKAHHSMIIDNVSDFTHAYLHRTRQPFSGAKLLRLDTEGDKVELEYATRIGGGITGRFVDRQRTDTNTITLAYEYPYQWSNTDDKIKHWCFVLPIDEQTTRAFFLFYFSPEMFRIPLWPFPVPRRLMNLVMHIAGKVSVKPLLEEDGFAVEAEQGGYREHFEQPIVELNPAVRAFQQLTIRKWAEHLAASGARR
jgi:phenylpropionate dioxygenase-like ring-hydroxylating dioxygenase large terminal subunit